MPDKQTPTAGQRRKPKPTPKQPTRPAPDAGIPENTVQIGNTLVELKPTKLKYQRNRTAMLYKLLDLYPIADVLAMDTGAFGPEDDRDGDKAVYDWLVAATDNEDLIREHYDELDTETIERILTIFRRINHIDEKEERQKKLQAAATALRSPVPSP